GGAQAMPMPKKPKQPVPKNAVWWCRAEGHPSLRYFGPELYHQRWEKRVWSLGDLSGASRLSLAWGLQTFRYLQTSLDSDSRPEAPSR
ncbi:MAG: hypothetical protein ABL974_18750, partial [Prosthecobacter sp.]